MPRAMTHQRFLVTALAKSTGPILEFGAGFYSTPILCAYGVATDRPVVTVESEPEWAAWAREIPGSQVIEGPYGETRAQVHALHPSWGVVFLDHDNASRMVELEWAKSTAQYVVCHDIREGSFTGRGPYPHERIDPTAPETLLASCGDTLEWVP